MGQEIVYCSRCAERLMGSDFDKGKAFRIGDMSACLKCARELLPTLAPGEREALAEMLKQVELKKSSGFLPAVRGSSSQTPAVSSSSTQTRSARASQAGFPSIKAQTPSEARASRASQAGFPSVKSQIPAEDESSRKMKPLRQAPPPPAEKPQSQSTVVVIVVVVLVVLVVLIAALSGGRSSSRASRSDEPEPAPVIVESRPTRPDPPTADPRLVPPVPVRPDPLKPVNVRAELDEIDQQIAPYLSREEFGSAREVLSSARPRHLDNSWFAEISARLQKLDADVRKLFTPLFAQAQEARAKKDEAAVGQIRGRVVKWGLAAYLAEFDAPAAPPPPVTADTKPVVPVPPPPPVAPSAPLVKALLSARGRDFEAAAKEADDAADQEGIRLAGTVPAEALAALGRWARGWNLAVTVWDPAGVPARIDDPVLRVEPTRAEVRHDKATLSVEFGEIAPASLAEIFRGRAAKKETDAKAAAYFCAIEGDAEAAKKNWPEIPPRVLAASQKAAESVNAAREAEARKLFHEADVEFRPYGSRPAAVPKFQKLLTEHADTAFVRRNKASIQSRSDGGKEYFFAPADLAGSGHFKPARHADGRSSWTMEEDAPDKAKKMDHAVELEFGALADADYRMWVFAGACCLETFAFSVQATDLAGAEPGGPTANPVSVGITFLKKTHASHGGRKEPSKWDWIQVPLKFASAGPKKVRLVSDQQGFSVAYAIVSTQRRSYPREAEAKELEKGRPALAVRSAGGAPSMGSILREWWLGVPGDSVADLVSNPAYPNKPTGSELLGIFEGPSNFADDYGTRIRGYVHPPLTGNYTFWTATDDYCDLYLSTTEEPNQKVRIAYQTGAVAKQDWAAQPSQRSNPIALVKGRRYYVEFLHKEGKVNDHLAVGWQLPDGMMERPIPGKRLSPWVPGGRASGLALQSPPAGAALPAPAKIDIVGEAFGGATVVRAEVFNGSARLGEAKAATLSYTWANVPAGAYSISMRAVDKSGSFLSSAPVLVRVGDVAFHRGVNLNGPALTIDGNAWEGRDAGGVSVKGAGFEFPEAELKPPADPERAQMIRASVTAPEGTAVTMAAVPNGTYQVYLYLWGEGDPRTFDLLVKGKVAQAAYSSAPGKWDRLGPWPVEVADGTIDVKASRAGACFSGLEVWRVGAPPPPAKPEKTQTLGGPGGAVFEDAPAGGQLVGFKITPAAAIRSIQPIYLVNGARAEGRVYGDAQGPTEVLAKPGYAVGAVVVRAGGLVDSLKVVFMRVVGTRLSTTERYESDWIGAAGAGTDVTLGGDGSPVVGIHGGSGAALDRLGLILLK